VAEPTDILKELRDAIRTFAAERDWEQFHTPKNLAVSVCIEAGELLEQFQWLTTGIDPELTESRRENIRNEMADVLMYLIRLADKLNIDLADAARHKLIINAKKYPVEKVRGDARKYDEYDKS
jgi:dCTP diphosphatase